MRSLLFSLGVQNTGWGEERWRRGFSPASPDEVDSVPRFTPFPHPEHTVRELLIYAARNPIGCSLQNLDTNAGMPLWALA
jgi:hypothetical protein